MYVMKDTGISVNSIFKMKERKNFWLTKLFQDLKQNRYNLKKHYLYHGLVKEHIEALLKVLNEDYDIK